MSGDEISQRFDLLDRAARKNDRWWFLALLMIGMVFVGYILWWGQQELVVRDNRITSIERDYISHLATNTTTANQTSQQLAGALSENARVVENNTRMLERVDRALTRP